MLIGIILFIILLFLSFVHVYWAFGGEWGVAAAVPTKENGEKLFKPSVLATLLVAVGLLSVGLYILAQSNWIIVELPNWLKEYGLLLIVAIFGFRAVGDFHYVGFFKKHKQTDFGKYDTMYYSPLCLFIAILTMFLYILK